MSNNDLPAQIKAINRSLQQFPWIDFEVMEYTGMKLVLMGSVDASAPHDVEIRFRRIAFVSLPFEWRTDTSIPPLSLLTDNRAFAINSQFRVEQGYHIFQLTAEDFPADFGCLIGAKEIEFHQLREIRL